MLNNWQIIKNNCYKSSFPFKRKINRNYKKQQYWFDSYTKKRRKKSLKRTLFCVFSFQYGEMEIVFQYFYSIFTVLLQMRQFFKL